MGRRYENVSLLTDYVLTVSVSVAAGSAALASAIPSLASWVVPISVAFVLIIAFGNLRGVKESGKVFAVSWQGPWLPNLQQLLGPYFADYTSVQNQRHSRGPLLIHQSNLVVQSSGHMRSFVGRAYVPDMLPQGVRVEDIH